MKSFEDLAHILARIDGRGYKAYKDLEGAYANEGCILYVDHVQGDPFAAPSKVRLRVPMGRARIPPELFAGRVRQVALRDFLAREVRRALAETASGAAGSGKSGLMLIDAGGQEVLERTACQVTADWVEARLYVGLPAAGRRVLGRQARAMLCQRLPRIAERSLLMTSAREERARRFVEVVENQEHIRAQLPSLNLAAFVADGAILPREAGNSQRPMPAQQAVRFESPGSLRVSIDVPNAVSPGGGRRIHGMGIPKGVTLIVGGGYHGKSTLLQALERGVYPHVPGDGREYVVTLPGAVKIRAEDGRGIHAVDISPFITNLPRGVDTHHFSTDNASGSTSQAANIIEALEMNASLLLVDEDTSATNFMVRDVRMQALVHKDFEPITPFIDRVREMYERHGVSTVLVMGGCGDYFDVADTVIMMREYRPEDVTAAARQVAQRYATQRRDEAPRLACWCLSRIPIPESFDPSRGRREIKIDAREEGEISFGTQRIDMRSVEQLVDASQARAAGLAVHLAASRFMDGRIPLREALQGLDEFLDAHGLDVLDPYHRAGRHPGSLARPRLFEVAAAVNRLRSARFKAPGGEA